MHQAPSDKYGVSFCPIPHDNVHMTGTSPVFETRQSGGAYHDDRTRGLAVLEPPSSIYFPMNAVPACSVPD